MAFDPNANNTSTPPPAAPTTNPDGSPITPAATPPNPATPATSTSSSAMPAGMDPALWAVYQNSGLTPADRGTGFADWQYWQGVGPSQYGRLASDIAGTGSDQSTGTPGTGAWDSSGGSGSGGGGVSAGAGAPPSFNTTVGGTPGSSVVGPSFIGQATIPFAQTPQDSTLLNTLLARSNQSLNVSPSDPVIAAQVDPYAATMQQGAANSEAAAAEAAGPHQNADAVARSASENAAQQTAGFQGTVMQNELNARRAEIQAALTQQGSTLTAEDQMALQQQLGLVNAQLGQQGLALGQQQLGSQNDQFAATYGLNATNQANYWNRVNSGFVTGA